MAFIEIKGKALRDFDAQRAAQPGVISRSGGGGPATYVTANNNRPISSYASNPAPYKPKTIAEYDYNPAPMSSPSRGAFGGMTTEGLSGFMGEPAQIKRNSDGGYSAVPMTPARPEGTGVPAQPGVIPRQRPAPQRPQTMASNGISVTPGARSAFTAPAYKTMGLTGVSAWNDTKRRDDATRELQQLDGQLYRLPPGSAEYNQTVVAMNNLRRELENINMASPAQPSDADRAWQAQMDATIARSKAGGVPMAGTLEMARTPGATGAGFGGAYQPTYSQDTSGIPRNFGAFGGSNAQGLDDLMGAPARPGPEVPPPTPLPMNTDYIAPTRSRFEDTPGFDQPAMAAAYVNQQRGDIQREYAGNLARIREEMAARGLSQAGVSGAEETAIMMNELSRANALGRSRADATARSMEMGREDAIQRAGQIDNFGLARGGLGISYGAANRAAREQDTMLPLNAQGKAIANEGGVISNQGGQIANQANQAAADVATATTQDRISQIRSIATNAQLQNEATRFDIDQAIQAAPGARQLAQAQLQEIEQRVAKAARENDWATVDQLGKLAARAAKAGGFKIVGGILGGIVGSIIPGAGTAAGAGAGTAAGAWLDSALGG